LDVEFGGRRNRGDIPGDDAIAAKLTELESKFC